MDKKKEKTTTIWEVIIGFFVVFGILFCLWLFNGGPQRAASEQGAFIQPIAPGRQAVIYGPTNPPPKALSTTTIDIPGLR